LNDDHENVRETAADSIVKIAPKNISKQMKEALRKNNSTAPAFKIINELKIAGLETNITAALAKASSESAKERGATVAGLFTVKSALSSLVKLSSDRSPVVRLSVAKALSSFKGNDVNSKLAALAKDKNDDVATAAINSMGIVGDKSFGRALLSAAKNLKVGPDTRAAACWSIARCGVADSNTMNWLSDLCIKAVISVEGDVKMHDTLNVRISAYYAMLDLTKSGAADKKYLSKLKKTLMFAKNPEFKKALKVANAYRDGKTLKPQPVVFPVPRLTIKMK